MEPNTILDDDFCADMAHLALCMRHRPGRETPELLKMMFTLVTQEVIRSVTEDRIRRLPCLEPSMQ